MSSILDFAAGNWKELLAAAAAVFGFWKYLDTRKRELSWRKTEFLFKQARFLDTDLNIAKAVRVLTGREPDVTVASIYGGSGLSEAAQHEYQDCFDKLLNLLDRIAYSTLHVKTLTEVEAANFGWYLARIAQEPMLVSYCKENGLGDVVELAETLKTESESAGSTSAV